MLRYEVEQLGIDTLVETEVKEIRKTSKGFDIFMKDGTKFFAHRVILAPGGKAAPNLGSNGSGYTLAEKLGHHLIEPFPALVQLKLDEPFLKQIKGIKFEGEAEIIVREKVLAKAQGEILFTEYGISGPPIFDLSRTAAEQLKRNQEVWVKTRIINHLSKDELSNYVLKRWHDNPEKMCPLVL